jgi:hypothetical protein
MSFKEKPSQQTLDKGMMILLIGHWGFSIITKRIKDFSRQVELVGWDGQLITQILFRLSLY